MTLAEQTERLILLGFEEGKTYEITERDEIREIELPVETLTNDGCEQGTHDVIHN